MKIDVTFDASQLETNSLKQQKRLVYNTVNALNKVALAAQKDIRSHMMQVFKLRGDKGFILKQVKITFASVKKGVLYAEVYVNPQPKRLLLAAFETGEERQGFVGKNVAEPNPSVARMGGSVAGSVLPSLLFSKMRFKQVTVTPRTMGDAVQFKGANRLFELKSTHNAPLGGVFQRVGPGRDDIRMVWSFNKPFRLHRLLDFVQIASTTMHDKFSVEFAIASASNPFGE